MKQLSSSRHKQNLVWLSTLPFRVTGAIFFYVVTFFSIIVSLIITIIAAPFYIINYVYKDLQNIKVRRYVKSHFNPRPITIADI